MIDIFWKRVLTIWRLLSSIESFFHTWYISEYHYIQKYLKELHWYKDEHSKMIAGQLVRYANRILKENIEAKKCDYIQFQYYKFSLK